MVSLASFTPAHVPGALQPSVRESGVFRHSSGSTVPPSARLCRSPFPWRRDREARPFGFPAEVSPREAAAGKKRMRLRACPSVRCVAWPDRTLGRADSPYSSCSAGTEVMFLMPLTPSTRHCPSCSPDAPPSFFFNMIFIPLFIWASLAFVAAWAFL